VKNGEVRKAQSGACLYYLTPAKPDRQYTSKKVRLPGYFEFHMYVHVGSGIVYDCPLPRCRAPKTLSTGVTVDRAKSARGAPRSLCGGDLARNSGPTYASEH
jgi:hypothetical protein